MSDDREESLYYLKIVFMYIELGTEVVLNTFVHHTPKKDAKLFLDSNNEKLQQLRRKKILNAEECKLVFSPSPNPEDFDISLLITLSINLFSEEELPPPKDGWYHHPKEGDTSVAADLLRLRTLRNVIVGHKSKARLPKWRFESEWETVREIFLRIYRAIAPENETQLKERLNACKQQRLDPCIENRYDAKLKEWHDEISKIQEEVEKSIQILQDYDKYFKSKSDRYERYIKLLVKGGRLVLFAFLEKKTKSQSESLQETLKRKEVVIRSKINNVDHLRVLYPSDHDTELKAIDTSTWGIPLLANVILHLFGDQLDEQCRDAVRTIYAAYENYAEAAFAALDSDNFEEYSSDLKYGLRSLKFHLDEQSKTDCQNILEECKGAQKGEETRTTYFDELKAQGMQIKSIADVHKEKLRKTTEILQRMMSHGIAFKNDHVVDLKMIPHGTDEEKKLLAENLLTESLKAAQEGSGDICDHQALRKTVQNFFKDITEWISNKRVLVRQECIILSVICSSPNEIFDLLTFLESTMFRAHLDSISQELGYQFNTVFKLDANVTAESLEEILYDKGPECDKAHGVTIPITVSSPVAMVELRSYLKSKNMMNSVSAISDHLSNICDDKITVEVSQDRTYLSQALEDLDRSSSEIASETSHIHKIKTKMAHQSQLENRKYRNWVKAGLGLKYTKEGLEPLCDQLVKQQHVDILSKVRQKHNLSKVSCGNCDIKILQPDHGRTRSKQCPLGQINCNCQQPGGKTICSVCGAIYDEIIQLHASTPPSPNWKNTDIKHWCTEPWAVAKCFINAAGYEKIKASEFDCSGLLHVLLNNIDFRDHLYCTTDGTDLLQKVLQHRNKINHSHDMELEDEDLTTYLDDMIALLQDDKELVNTKHPKAAVIKLEELKHEDFVITTTNETEIRRAVMADVGRITKEAEHQKHELGKKGKEVSDQIVKTGNKQKIDLNQKELHIKESIKDAVTKGKVDLTEKGDQIRDQIIGIGTQKKTDLDQTEIDIKESIKDAVTKGMTDLIENGDQVRDQIVGLGTKQKNVLDQKEKDIRESIKDAVTKGKVDLTEKGDHVRDQILSIRTNQRTGLDQKEIDIKESIRDTVTKIIMDLTEKGDQVQNEIVSLLKKQETDLDRREVDMTANIEDLLAMRKTDLAEQGNQVKDGIVRTGMKLKADMKRDIVAETTKGKLELEQKRKEIETELKTKLDIELEQKVKRDTTIERVQTMHDLDFNHKKTRERLDVTDSVPSALNNSGGFGQQFKKENDDTLCQTMVETLHDQMKSVGVLIFCGFPKGTVFRVGTNRVMTAFHVVKDILDPSLLTGNKTFINFNESASDPPVMMYRIKEHAILNKHLDVAVLEISNPSNLPKKMALRKPKSSETGVTNVSLIGYGHTTHGKKCLDPKCEILSPNAQRIISALASLQQKSGYYKTAMQQTTHNPNLVDSGYEGYDHPTKTIFNCFMEHGGSGAPAVTNDNQRAIEVVAMFTNGLPKFYFYLPPQLQTEFPKEYRLELGTNMTSIYKWIKDTQPESLLKDLFN